MENISNILGYLKGYLNIDEYDKKNKDNIFIDRILYPQAIKMIEKYLNYYDDPKLVNYEYGLNDYKYIKYIEENHQYALLCCIEDLYNSLKNENGNIQSMTQGQRSISYNTNFPTELSDRVKAMLPPPRVRLL